MAGPLDALANLLLGEPAPGSVRAADATEASPLGGFQRLTPPSQPAIEGIPPPPPGFRPDTSPPPPPAGFKPETSRDTGPPPPPPGFVPEGTPRDLFGQTTDRLSGQSTPPKNMAPDNRPEIVKGFEGGLIGSNKSMTGRAMQGLGDLLDNSWLSKTGEDLAASGKKDQEGNKARVPSFTNIRTDSFGNFISDVGSYAGYSAGNAAGTSAPSLVTGIGTAMLTANPIIGVIAGAAGPSYIQNFGDVYGSVLEDKDIAKLLADGKVSKKWLAGVSAGMAVPIAAIDSFELGTVIGKTVFANAKRTLIKRVAHGIAVGSITEGTGEGLQEVLSQWTQDMLGSQSPMSAKVISVIDNALGGLFGGGLLGAAGGVPKERGAHGTPPPGTTPPPAGTTPPGTPPPTAQGVAAGLAGTPGQTNVTVNGVTAPVQNAPPAGNPAAILKAAGWSDADIADMDPAELAAEADTASKQGVTAPAASQTVTNAPPAVEDRPSAEPIRDLAAQARDLNDPKSTRSGMYLSPENAARFMALPKEARSRVGAMGVWLDNFDGQGGILIAKDVATADKAREDLAAGRPIQEIIGEMTGSGSGKPADGKAVVQQRDETGAVTRESLVNDATVAPTQKDMAAPGRTVHTITPEEALQRRQQEIDDEAAFEGAATKAEADQAASSPVTTPNDVTSAADPYAQAVDIVRSEGKASTSFIQRKLGLGYNAAATLIERMEKEGVVGPANSNGRREVLAKTEAAIPPPPAGFVPEGSREHVEAAASQAHTSPTDGQKAAGNYQKGHINLHGLDITIENAKGSTRSGTGKDGKPWSVDMPGHYGYIRRTEGNDGDQLDVTIGDHPESTRAFVVDQIDPETKNFDEHKLFVAVNTDAEARDLYDRSFSDGSGVSRAGAVTEMSIAKAKRWAKTGDTTKPVAYIKGKSNAGVDERGKAAVPAADSRPSADAVRVPPVDENASDGTPDNGRLPAGDGSADAGVDTGRTQPNEGGRKAKVKKSAKPKEPPSLLKFIAGYGGITIHDHNGELLPTSRGDLAAMGITEKYTVPFVGKLIRTDGKPLDRVREAVAEAGYFHDQWGDPQEAVANSTVADLMNLIGQEAGGHGKVYAQEDLAQLADWQAARGMKTGAAAEPDREGAANEKAARKALDDLIAEHDLGDQNPQVYTEAARLIAEGASPSDAYEQAWRTAYDDETLPAEAERLDAIPGWTDEEIDQAISRDVAQGGEPDRPNGEGEPSPRGPPQRTSEGRPAGGQDEISADIQGDGGETLAAEVKQTDKHIDQPSRVEREEAAAPAPTTEKTEAGQQTVLPGAEQASDKTMAQRKADATLKAKVAQKPADQGLFGDEKDQTDLMDLVRKPAPATEAAATDESIFETAVDAAKAAEQAPFDAAAWNKGRADAIDASKASGVKHLDQIAPTVETMRGLEIYNVHDPRERGTVRTVANTGEVVIHWADEYSAKKNLAEATQQGKKSVHETWLAPSDLKDYAVGQPATAAPAGPRTSRQRRPRDERSAGQAAVSAVKNVAKGLDDVTSGLAKLFGADPSRLGSGPSFDEETYRKALPLFKSGVAHFKQAGVDIGDMIRALVAHLAKTIPADTIRAMKPYVLRFAADVRSGKETLDAPSSNGALESTSGEPAVGDGLGQGDLSAATGTDGQGARPGGNQADETGSGQQHSGSPDQGGAPFVGAPRDIEIPRSPAESGERNASYRDDQRSGRDSSLGLSFEFDTTEEARQTSEATAGLERRRKAQREVEGSPVTLANKANVAATLPMLFPEQQDDVYRAEKRFAKADGHGMMFTNGTGTGKTFSGLGVAKRFAKQGKRNILIVAPSQPIISDWGQSAKDLQLDITPLADTQDSGTGFSSTTYANFGANPNLADRQWDLIIFDESHKLTQGQEGTATAALKTARALTQHPDGYQRRAEMVFRQEWEKADEAHAAYKRVEKTAAAGQAYAAYEAALKAFNEKAEPAIKEWKNEPRTTKTLFMSATPFAYHFSLDYAEGYLFEHPKPTKVGGYSDPTGRDLFYINHFGYRIRTGKLTKPDAEVNSEVMEREFHEHLRKEGSLWGRALEVDRDYDRKFVLVHSGIGADIDRAMKAMMEDGDGRFRPFWSMVSKKFDFLTRMRLLEAIKARSSIDYIKAQHALGRKVVVFHDYNEGGGINPFDLQFTDESVVNVYDPTKHMSVEVKAKPLWEEFLAANPYVKALEFNSYLPPIAELQKAFPDALIYNGTITPKKKMEAKRLFNDQAPDGKGGVKFEPSGRNLIIIQSQAGEAGISLHDTWGKPGEQRMLVNLGMPSRPTTAIQEEGRIYRVGQMSDALFRYLNTGTNWERWTFAAKIAERAGTAENLALGNLARRLRMAFVDGFNESDEYPPSRDEGKGGKAADRADAQAISEFERAKTHYFGQQKNKKSRQAREGVDYYATPEPLGFKMVEWASLKPNERFLEPSAGHGAIARYAPEDTHRTLVEPSSELASKAALYSPGARVVVGRFENLHISNKYDAIVMNPPFGVGGKTAIDHVEKAMGHLANGGRIVALLPTGQATDRLGRLMDSPAAKGIYLVADIQLPAVTFERAGTSIRGQIVILEKQTDAAIRNQLQQTSRDYSGAETIKEFFDRIEHAEMKPRLEPITKEAPVVTEGASSITIGGASFALNNTSSSVSGKFTATLENRVGPAIYARTAKAAEANGGKVGTRGIFGFPTAEARAKFFDHLASPPAAAPETAIAPANAQFKLAEFMHTRTGAKVFVAKPITRLSNEDYGKVKMAAQAHRGWWSSFSSGGAIAGFLFNTEQDRTDFLGKMAPPPAGGPGNGRMAHVGMAPIPQTQTPAFKEWFGASKVVDKDGKPIRAYHGTNKNFDVFQAAAVRREANKSRTWAGDLGTWFAAAVADPENHGEYEPESAEFMASTFAGEDWRAGIDHYVAGANVMPVYLSIKNPAEMEGYEDLLDAAHDAGGIPQLRVKLIAEGHDGVVIRDSSTDGNVFRDDWVTFHPEQIKSATGNTGAFDPKNPSILAASAPAKPFFSALLRAAENAKIEKGTYAQWVGTLMNAPGVKPEEFEWVARGWLDDQASMTGGNNGAPKAITKADLVAAIRANQIDVRDVLKGEGVNDTAWAPIEEWAAANGLTEELIDLQADPDLNERSLARALRELGVPFYLVEAWAHHGDNDTRHSGYQLPGGQDYRELLLTLPGQSKLTRAEAEENIKRGLFRSSDWSTMSLHQRESMINQEMEFGRPGATFTHTHWDEKNVLAHVRFNTRTINQAGFTVVNKSSGNRGPLFADRAVAQQYIDGLPESIRGSVQIVDALIPKKVLFIEEIQSDWHQAGRKRGYAGENGPKVFREADENDIDALRPVLEDSYTDPTNPDRTVEVWMATDGRGDSMSSSGGFPDNYPSRAAAIEAINRQYVRMADRDHVTNAPFKGAGWSELAMKRMVHYAAANGYDAIAWTPGDVQNDRYTNDIRQRVESIAWGGAKRMGGAPNESRLVAVTPVGAGRRGPMNFFLDDRGVVLDVSGGGAPTEARGKTIEDLVGKDIATKIMSAPEGNVSGDNLFIGGEGMRGFYDKILPGIASKIGKRFGAKVGTAKIVTHKGRTPSEWRLETGAPASAMPTAAGIDETKEVWSMPITDAMRTAVTEQGQPLFNRTVQPIDANVIDQLANEMRASAAPQVRAFDRLINDIRSQIARMVGPSVDVKFADVLNADDVVGSDYLDPMRRASEADGRKLLGTVGGYWDANGVDGRAVIALALGDPNYNPRTIQYHEAFHHFVEWLATDAELRLLASEMGRLRALAGLEYEMTPEAARLLPEAEIGPIAFQRYGRLLSEGQPVAGFHIGIRRLFGRIAELLAKIKRYLNRKGITSYANIEEMFGAMVAGDFANRTPRTDRPYSPRQEARTPAPRPAAPTPATAPAAANTPLTPATIRAGRQIARVPSFGDRHRVNLQDRELMIRRAEEDMARQAGVPMPEFLSTYQAAGLFPGKTKAQLVDLKRDRTDPLIVEMQAAGISAEELGDFLYARHHSERRAQMLAINPSVNPANDPYFGSGMSDQEAVAILRRIAAAPNRAAYASLAVRVDQIVHEARETMVRNGLISRDVADEWARVYPHYVPLRGFEANDENTDRPKASKGFQARGPESKAAMGRRSKADNPLLYVFMQAEQAIVRSEKNRIAKTFLRFIQAFPDPSRWVVYRGTMEKRINPTTGLVETYWARPPFTKDNDHLLQVKIGGKTTWVHIKDVPIARAMLKVGSVDHYGPWLSAAMRATRLYAKLLTSWNPEFTASNMIRDLETALINVSDIGNKPPGIRRRIVTDALSLKSIRGIMQALRSTPTGQMAVWFEEFRHAGGVISWYNLDDIDSIRTKIEASMKSGRVREGVRKAAQLLEDLNSSVENGVRLSVYVSLRENGFTADRAAFISRELTVNFNRKGELGPVINTLYMFYNASAQGLIRVAQALKRSPVARAAFASIMAAGMMVPWINLLTAGDDDDGENLFLKLMRTKPYLFERNLVIMFPGDKKGRYITLPLAWIYNLPFYAGHQTFAALQGVESPAGAAMKLAGAAIDALNPIGGLTGSVWQAVSPTLLDPFAQATENKTWFGAPIQPTKYDRHKPDSENYFASVPEWAKWMSRRLNELGGGNVAKSAPAFFGALDVSPEVLQHYADTILTGPFKMIGNVATTIKGTIEGAPVDPEHLPFARRFLGTQDSSTARRAGFYDLWEGVDAAHAEQLGLRNAAKHESIEGNPTEATRHEKAAEALFKTHSPELETWKAFDNTRKQLTEFASRRRAIDATKAPDRIARIAAVDKEEAAAINAAVTSLFAARKRAAAK